MSSHAEKAAHNLALVREKRPLVHNITNYVVMQYTANALLALGASPVMAHAVEEMEEMASLASAPTFGTVELRGGNARVVLIPALGGKISELWGIGDMLGHARVFRLGVICSAAALLLLAASVEALAPFIYSIF